MYKLDFLKAQNKWEEILKINEKLKNDGEFDNSYINDFSWEVYEKCNNQEVIKKCIVWMKEVTDQEPNYAYLDTYAHLLYKSGNKTEAKKITKLAIETASKENKEFKSIEKLINKL
ncbi:hypothetical protein H9X57_14465 [Flavobacterium piscinae]|nr:hypothetical protein [Flavobacterium piscinae]MBC8884117.1 hypothetical protein [Flavobacterium piscinae]